MTLVVMSLNCHTYLLFSFFVAHNLKHIVVITLGRVKFNSELRGLKGNRCLKKKNWALTGLLGVRHYNQGS